MAWYLRHGKRSVRLRDGRIIGREDFPDAGLLSKHHLKFTRAKRVGWRVRDLDSRHGTSLRGDVLVSDRDFVVNRGDRLSVGDADFIFEQKRSRLEVALFAFALIIALVLIDPATSFGRAIGLLGWATFGLSALVTAVLTGLVSPYMVNGRRPRLGLGAALVLALGFEFGQLMLVGRWSSLRDRVGRARIEYSCLANFRGRSCVQQVEACVACAHHVEAPKRDLIIRSLVAAKRGLPIPQR